MLQQFYNHYLFSDGNVLNLRTPVGVYVAEKLIEKFDDADEADEETEEGIEEYLRNHIQGYISIRYQSKRANSARRWRELKLIDFDDTFIYTEDPESERLIRYRRDGIVEYK